MKPLRIPTLLCLAAIGLLTSPTANATLLVKWGTTPPANNALLSLGTATNNGETRTYLNAKSPTSGYSDTPFRAMLEQTLSTTGAANFAIARIDPTTFFYVRGASETSAPATTTIRGLVYFEKAEFLNGGNSDIVTLANNSSMSLNIRKYGGTLSVRMAVLDGSQWYLSESSFSSTGTFTLTDFSSQHWASWDPSGAPLPPVPGNFLAETPSFTDIKSFGFYFESTQADITKFAELQILSFEVNGSIAVPEPSIALLSGTVLLGAGALKFRRRSISLV